MKFKIYLNVILTAIILLLNGAAFCQYENSISGSSAQAPESFGIPFASPVQGQYLRALIIHVTFKDDYEDGPDWNIWPCDPVYGSPPVNPYTNDGRMIDHEEQNYGIPFMNRYSEYTYSDFFCEMSRGEYDFIGDEIHIHLPLPSIDYINLGYNRASLNRYILEYANTNIPSLDFTRYDKWSYSNGNWVWGSDGTAEMIIMHYRRIPNNDDGQHAGWFWPSAWGGEASLGFSNPIVLDGVTIGYNNGVTALGLLNRLTRTQLIVEHEVIHYALGHTSLGLMTPGHGQSTYLFLPHEREAMGYITPTTVNYYPAVQDFTLGDYTETGQVLKIAIPGASGETFFIANHQKKSKYDGLSRGSNACWLINRAEQDPYCDVGKGLYIYHQSNCSYNFGMEMDIECSDGKYTWDLDRYVYVPELEATLPLMKEISRDHFYGRTEYHQYYLNPNFWSAQLLNDNPCSDDPKDVFINNDFSGDGLDAYNIGYDEIFSPYSNPASNSCQNPSQNSGLTIKLLSQNQITGEISIRIYFDDNEAISECSPSKPKDLKVNKYDIVPEHSFHPKLTWSGNIEPDFDGIYNIYRGVSFDCNTIPQFYYLTTIVNSNSIVEFVDDDITLYYGQQYQQGCGSEYMTYFYKVSAVDEYDMESLKSDRRSVSGWSLDCYGSEGGDMLNNNNIENKYILHDNYPNPFNPVTNIQYSISKEGFVSLKVYDVLGREVKSLVNEFKQAGSYIVSFDGSELSSGIYFYRLEAGEFVQVKRMVLIK